MALIARSRENEVIAQFVRSVAAEFGLSEIVSVSAMSGSANRLWRFLTPQGHFVVKEFPYISISNEIGNEQYVELCKAAHFEAMLVGQQLVLAPAPVKNRNGTYVSVLDGSRGEEIPIRLHQWFQGAPPRVDHLATLVEAGCTLRAIQTAGSVYSLRPTGSLWQWHTELLPILEDFLAAGQFDDTSDAALHRTVADALEIVQAGEALSGDWFYTHCDYKPENCLSHNGRIAVLDWDECSYCHPRLEAVEAALRWAGGAKLNPEKFVAFITGYNESGTAIDGLQDADFAKWIAALLKWFDFQARRALGEWTMVTGAERATAAILARDALFTLQSSLTTMPQWTRLL